MTYDLPLPDDKVSKKSHRLTLNEVPEQCIWTGMSYKFRLGVLTRSSIQPPSNYPGHSINSYQQPGNQQLHTSIVV